MAVAIQLASKTEVPDEITPYLEKTMASMHNRVELKNRSFELHIPVVKLLSISKMSMQEIGFSTLGRVHYCALPFMLRERCPTWYFPLTYVGKAATIEYLVLQFTDTLS